MREELHVFSPGKSEILSDSKLGPVFSVNILEKLGSLIKTFREQPESSECLDLRKSHVCKYTRPSKKEDFVVLLHLSEEQDLSFLLKVLYFQDEKSMKDLTAEQRAEKYPTTWDGYMKLKALKAAQDLRSSQQQGGSGSSKSSGGSGDGLVGLL